MQRYSQDVSNGELRQMKSVLRTFGCFRFIIERARDGSLDLQSVDQSENHIVAQATSIPLLIRFVHDVPHNPVCHSSYQL